MRRMLLCLFPLVLIACGNPPAPVATPVPPTVEVPVLLSLQTLLEQPAEWSGRQVILIAAIAAPDARVLFQGSDPSGNAITDDPAGALWLAEPLPAKTAPLLVPGTNYLKLRGRLSPPGGYGTDGHYVYQFSAETVSVIEPELTTVANIADNPRSMDGALVRVTGILLLGEDATLMVDTISDGGVPPANARQVKIRDLAPDQIPPNLEQRGAVRFGEVTTTGWMQNGILRPFEMR